MKKKIIYEQLNRQYADSLDSRYKFATRDALQEYLENEETAYTGQIVYIEDEGGLYILDVATKLDIGTKEDTVEIKLHEVMLVDKLDSHLVKSVALKNTIDKVYADVQKGITEVENNSESAIQEAASAISGLSGNVKYILDFLQEKYPDDFKQDKEEPTVDESNDGTFDGSDKVPENNQTDENPPEESNSDEEPPLPVNMEE